MSINETKYYEIIKQLDGYKARLVAVSKIKPVEIIKQCYDLGQRDFGENYVQELVDKEARLPKDIRWHFIGHLQSNKVKFIAPFVSLIHGVDSLKLLKEINKQGKKNERVIDVLLQVHIATEETKFGLDEQEVSAILESEELKMMQNIRICGLMGMASFSEDPAQVRSEFKSLKLLFDRHSAMNASNVTFNTLSMGMSNDYEIALEEGSTMVRIGSLLFGNR
jgi:pyridoxal phosphate enzyme (YggS family)